MRYWSLPRIGTPNGVLSTSRPPPPVQPTLVPWPSLALSLALRTSYHAYYGIGLIATVPFGYWATRSFQKHRRLGRPIIAHFLNDAVILTAAVLTS